MCCLLVSGFLTEITQQIHSLRASGVISSHFACAAGSEMRAFRKSAGIVCTAPAEIAFLATNFILPGYATGLESRRTTPGDKSTIEVYRCSVNRSGSWIWRSAAAPREQKRGTPAHPRHPRPYLVTSARPVHDPAWRNDLPVVKVVLDRKRLLFAA
jgi:hypothetical protein